MVKLDDAVIAKLKKGEHTFEILVDPYKAWDYKHNKTENVNFDDFFAMETIYSDANKGKEASLEVMKKVFQTDDFLTVAKEIILHGDVQITTAQRNDLLEKRKKEILDYIVKNAHDPKLLTPIPLQRILNILDEAKYKFNLSRTKKDEVNEVIMILKKAIPISFESVIIDIEISPSYSGKVLPILHKYKIIDEKWLSNGSLFTKIEIPIGLKNTLISEINNITHGEAVIKMEGA